MSSDEEAGYGAIEKAPPKVASTTSRRGVVVALALASLAVASVVALQGGAAGAAALGEQVVCKDPCATPFNNYKSCSDATTGSCGVRARVELQDLAAAHAAPHNGRRGTITAVGDRFQVDFDAGGPNFPFVNPANLKPLCDRLEFPSPAKNGCGVGDRVELQYLEAAHAVGYNGYQGTVTEITGDNRLKVAFDAGGPMWPTVNPANLKLLCAYGNPRPPSWMTPDSCAGGLPGFDPSGFKLGDVDVTPKFKFNLGKIKFKF